MVCAHLTKKLILDLFPIPDPVLSGVYETDSTCSIYVGSIPFTFKAVREILNESDLVAK